MKFSIILIFAISFSFQSYFGQQIALNSQYIFNTMLINPGATGLKDHIPVQINFRKQWTNFPGSPTTQFLSCESKVDENFGIGGVFFNDIGGASRRTGLNLNASYKLQLDSKRDHIISFGLGVSLTQHMMDMSVLTTYLPDDPSVLRGYNNQMVPDANFGLLYTLKNNFYVGLSSYNLSQSKRDLYNFNSELFNPLARNYYLTSGYKFKLADAWALRASTLIQAIETGTTQFDISSIVEYNELYWIGVSYRLNDAAVVLCGAQIGPLKFGYSYDLTLSDIGQYSTGSHEIFMEFQITRNESKNQRVPWLKRNRIYTPSNEK
jgi:type IX secretion system PorP/SprF family membrane protein